MNIFKDRDGEETIFMNGSIFYEFMGDLYPYTPAEHKINEPSIPSSNEIWDSLEETSCIY